MSELESQADRLCKLYRVAKDHPEIRLDEYLDLFHTEGVRLMSSLARRGGQLRHLQRDEELKYAAELCSEVRYITRSCAVRKRERDQEERTEKEELSRKYQIVGAAWRRVESILSGGGGFVDAHTYSEVAVESLRTQFRTVPTRERLLRERPTLEHELTAEDLDTAVLVTDTYYEIDREQKQDERLRIYSRLLMINDITRECKKSDPLCPSKGILSAYSELIAEKAREILL